MNTYLRTFAIGAVLALSFAVPFAAAQQTPSSVEAVPAAPSADGAATPTAPEATPPAAPASETTATVVGPPPANKSFVIVFRPSRMAGGAITFTAMEGDNELGRLSNGRYIAVPVDPGIHEFRIRGGESARFEVEEGETYYLQLNIAMGLMSGRGVLAPSDKATFERRPLQAYTPD